jgi:hypothetical protein
VSLSDSELLDAVKERLGKRTDIELAKLLRVANTVVSGVRANRRKLPVYSRALAFDLLGYEWAKIVLKYVLYDDLKVPKKAE